MWVGVGAIGTAILGMILFGEPATPGRLTSLGFIVGHRRPEAVLAGMRRRAALSGRRGPRTAP